MSHSIRLGQDPTSVVLQTPSGQDIAITDMATLLQFLRNATRRNAGLTPREWVAEDIALGRIARYDARGKPMVELTMEDLGLA